MALDGIFLHLLKNEIKKEALGSRVEKIHQPAKNELVFSLRSRSSAHRLLISCSGNAARVHFTQNAPENPQNPPMLCMLLRKHLTGAILEDISQPGFERILFLRFDATNEIGDRVVRTLVIEIMAQHSNIILIDENGVIIDSVKRVDSLQSSVREVLPSLPYTLPPGQDKIDILKASDGEIMSRLGRIEGKTLSGALLSSLQGVSPILCRELAHRAYGGDIDISEFQSVNKDSLLCEINNVRNLVINDGPSPCAVSANGGKLLDFSFLPITQYVGAAEYKTYDTLSELLDEFYYERERLARTKARAEDLFRLINNLIERTSRKINNQKAELRQSEGREEKRIFAELINANAYRLEKRSLYYIVENYYDNNNELKIPADLMLTPVQNAQRYYKEYRKAQTAEIMLTGQIKSGEADLEYFFTVLDALSRASSEREISEIRQELFSGGYLKKRGHTAKNAGGQARGKVKNPPPMPPLEFTSPDGFKVLVGRNNIQNEKLSMRTALKTDIWFHAQKIPGSHVILVLDNREATQTAMEYAASLAAYYSGARGNAGVPVDYTQVKNLKKPNGAKPGFVVYHVYNTMIARSF